MASFNNRKYIDNFYLPAFLEHFLEAEFQHFNEGEEVLQDYHLEEFMLAGYPDTDRERIRKGVRVVLEEFGDGTRLTWQDLSRMYTISWHTDPSSVQSEFINRGFRCLKRIGPVLNEILSFGFNPYVIQIQKGDTEEIIQEKCFQCVERMTSKILILIVSKICWSNVGLRLARSFQEISKHFSLT